MKQKPTTVESFKEWLVDTSMRSERSGNGLNIRKTNDGYRVTEQKDIFEGKTIDDCLSFVLKECHGTITWSAEGNLPDDIRTANQWLKNNGLSDRMHFAKRIRSWRNHKYAEFVLEFNDNGLITTPIVTKTIKDAVYQTAMRCNIAI